MQMRIPLLSVAIGTAWLCSTAQTTTINKNETKGACSQNVSGNNNTITIQCSGFNEKQMKQIMNFLGQLTKEQAKDQEVILSKLDQIIAAQNAQRAHENPRTISDEQAQQFYFSALPQSAGQQLKIVAPHRNEEAAQLASRLRAILRKVGWLVPEVDYQDVPEAEEPNADLLFVSEIWSAANAQFLGSVISHSTRLHPTFDLNGGLNRRFLGSTPTELKQWIVLYVLPKSSKTP